MAYRYQPALVPLDDTFIGALIDHVGFGNRMDTSDSICVGVNYDRLGEPLSTDECVLAGMVLVHGFTDIRFNFQLVQDSDLEDTCNEGKADFMVPLKKKWENNLTLFYQWKSYYKNFFGQQNLDVKFNDQQM